jgi:phage/plasmid primase-like uncharacterized protein
MKMIEQFRDAIRAAGIEPPSEIVADGGLHRFATNGKRGDDAGWYIFHSDGIPAGAFGCWRMGISQKWRADIGRTLTAQEQAEHCAKVEAIRRERDAEKKRRRAEARKESAAIWNDSHRANENHQYLRRKRVRAHGVHVHEGRIVVPLRDERGEMHSLQFIDDNGEKQFLTGGRVTGCYFSTGEMTEGLPICVAEGFATAATIHESTGYPVAVAFNAGNLEPVAKVLRAKFPEVTLIICADDDVKTEGNPGLAKAKAAALAVRGKLAMPDFGGDRPEGATDFNDLAALRGPAAVKQFIDAAKVAELRKGPTGFNLVSANELLAATEPDTRWIWDGVLPEGGLSLIVGKPKAGKSTFAFALSLAVAQGRAFLNRSTVGGAVVYLALEEKRGEVKKKLEAASGQVEKLFFHFGAAPSDAVPAINDLIKDTQPRLLVIDVLQKFIRVRDLNDYALVTNALEPLLIVARDSGCHVLLTHHAGKADRPDGDEVLGSTALLGGVDTLVSIKKRDGRRSFFTIQRYGDDISETVIELHPDGSLDDIGNRQDVEIDEMCPVILDVLGHSEMTTDEIVERVDRKRALVLKAVAKLYANKKLIRNGSGKKRDPYRYKKDSVFPFPNTDENGGTESTSASNPPSQNALFGSQEVSEIDSVPASSETSWETLP